MHRLIVPLALLALGACSGATNTLPDEPILRGEGRSAQERELNRAALEELRQRTAESPPAQSAPDDALEVVVLQPERDSALTDDGALKRSAVLAFVELGPHALLGAVTMVPARTDSGSARGFELVEFLEGGGFLAEGGLRPGDVVTAVNGRSILLPDAFMAVWESLDEAESLSVELLRDGEEMTLEWPIRDGI